MATLVSFWSFFGDRMADLSLIDFKLSFYIKVNVNKGQNKYEVNISKNVAKMAILWPKIGRRHFGARASHGHNLAIFYPILTNEHTKMTSSLRRIEWNKILSSISLFCILVYWPHFCSEASHRQCCTNGLKTTLKLLVNVLAIMASSCLKIVFLQKSGLTPPPPPLNPATKYCKHCIPDTFARTLEDRASCEQSFEFRPRPTPFFRSCMIHWSTHSSQCISCTTSRMQLLRGVWGELHITMYP